MHQSFVWESHRVNSELYWVDCKKIIWMICLTKNKHCGHKYKTFKERYNFVSEKLSNKLAILYLIILF